MALIKLGSKWRGTDEKVFVVLGTMIVEGKNWVYYRLENPKDHLPSEFSCYEESFLSRFNPLPE